MGECSSTLSHIVLSTDPLSFMLGLHIVKIFNDPPLILKFSILLNFTDKMILTLREAQFLEAEISCQQCFQCLMSQLEMLNYKFMYCCLVNIYYA